MSQCSLIWNEFTHSVSKTYRDIRNKDYFSDVTIVGNDQKPVFAHKLVISGGSQYFENLLKPNKQPSHVLLCLDGINSEQLNSLLDYIYFGEAQVYQDQLRIPTNRLFALGPYVVLMLADCVHQPFANTNPQ